jgi:hypothetical protein
MPSRRKILKLGGSTAIAGVASGCSSFSTDEGTPTSNGVARLLNEEISISASIQSQSTSEHPALVEFTVENADAAELTILPKGSGQALEKLTNYKSGNGEFELVPYPVNPDHMARGAPLSESTGSDCWRMPADFSYAVEDMTFEVEVQPNDEYSKRHYLFYEGPRDTCLPSREYNMTTPMGVSNARGSEAQIHLLSQIEVSQSGQLSVTAHFELYAP